MKKSIAIILLIVGAVIGWSVVWYGGFWLWAANEVALSVIVRNTLVVLVMLAVTFGTDSLRRLFKRKYALAGGWFMLCAYAPAAFWLITSVITTIDHRNSSYDGFLGGLNKAYDQQYTPAAAIALVGGALLWLVIFTLVGKRRNTT